MAETSRPTPRGGDPPRTALIVAAPGVRTGKLNGFLKRQGYRVPPVSSLGEAVARTRRSLPDVIVVCCAAEGVDLLADLLMEHGRAAVVLAAATPRLAEVVAAVKMGAVDFLDWPPDLGRLKRVLEEQSRLPPVG